MGFTARMALCLAGLAGAANACSFLPCDEGCTAEFSARDVSDRITLECEGTERQAVSLQGIHSCHVGAEPAVSTTPDVCSVEAAAAGPGGLIVPGGVEAVCKKAGTCNVFRKLGFSQMECKCPPTPPPTPVPEAKECELPKGWTKVGTPEVCRRIRFVCDAGMTYWGDSECGCGCRPEGEYFLVEQDFRRCAAPACGGFWLTAVNRKQTTCADGSEAERCYVAGMEGAAFQLDQPKQLVKGTQVVRTLRGFTLGSLVLDVDFDQASSEAGTGIFLSVAGKRAAVLNRGGRSIPIASVSFARGLDEKFVEAAKERLAAAREVVLAGKLRWVRERWAWSLAVDANQIYQPASAVQPACAKGYSLVNGRCVTAELQCVFPQLEIITIGGAPMLDPVTGEITSSRSVVCGDECPSFASPAPGKCTIFAP